jgi:adenylate cyclase
MRDRIVMIGPIAPSLKDFFYTPYSGNSITTPETMAGVEVQANIASQILSSVLDGRSGIQSWNDWQEGLWILLWAGTGAVLGWVARSPRGAIGGAILTLGSLVLGCYAAFLLGWWIPVVPATMALIISSGVLTSYTAYLEHAERQTIMNIFGRHVTPEIAEAIWRDRDQLLERGKLPGRKMTATVLFTDLKDFSTVSEGTTPEVLMSWLNEYMEAMTQVVLDHGGIVDKFIGDSIMAVFGVPIARTTPDAIAKDAYQAVKCSVNMALTLEALNRKWMSEACPTTSMRVGISTGPVVTGSLGGKQRLDYTTIGDSVNVASRLESYDKTLEAGICRILINESTYDLVRDQFPIRFLANVQLKGRGQPTKIYQILLESFNSEPIKPHKIQLDQPQ